MLVSGRLKDKLIARLRASIMRFSLENDIALLLKGAEIEPTEEPNGQQGVEVRLRLVTDDWRHAEGAD